MTDDLNKRQGRGCYMVSGFYAPFVAVTAILATGGETMETCRGQGQAIGLAGQERGQSPCPTVCEEPLLE